MIDRSPSPIFAVALLALAFAAPALAQSSDLFTTKTANGPAFAGADLGYSISVINAGPDDSAAVTLLDVVPTNTTFVSFSAPSGWSCTTPAPGGTGLVQCSAPTLEIDITASFTLVVNIDDTVPSMSQIFNSANAQTSTDPNTFNNTGQADTFVLAIADVAIEKTATPPAVVAGESLTYGITLTNLGPSNSGATSFSDPLPAGTSFVSLVSPPGWSCSTPPVGSGGQVACSIATLSAGSAVFTLVVEVDPAAAPGSTLSNTVTASSRTGDPNIANSSATAEATVLAPTGGPAPLVEVPALGAAGLLALALLIAALALFKLRR